MEGNQQKMREALKSIWKEVYHYAIEADKQDFAHLQEVMLDDPPEYKDLRNSFLAIAHLVDAALSSSPRNCDMGTAEEQERRFRKYCETEECNRYRCGHGCKAVCIDRCVVVWAQMPYAHEGGAK